MRLLFSIVLTLFLIVMLPVVAMAVLVLIQAEVNHTRLFVFGIIALFITLYFGQRHFSTDTGHPARWAVLFLLVTGGFFAASYQTAPSGMTDAEQTGFTSVYDNGAAHYPRWHPANLIAERDQVAIALTVSGWMSHDYDDERGRGAKRTMKDIYDDLEYHAEELIDYGSQLYRSYAEWLGNPAPGTHRYVYRSPQGKTKVKMPVILLLHSGEGNLKAGLWALKPLADEMGMAILAPTLDHGDWENPEGLERLHKALEFCRQQPDLDDSAIVLVGYGRGGAGVNLAARESPQNFRGLVHIASEFTPETTRGVATSKALENLPVLVFHGAKDRLIRIENVEQAINNLKQWKLPVTYHRSEEAGAMLLFEHSTAVCERIAAWIRAWPSNRRARR